MVEVLASSTPRAAKPHRYYYCGEMIAKGERHNANACREDGAVYTIRSHTDCHAAALEYISEGYGPDYEDGVPPLYEMIENGDGQYDLDRMRGHWPHVVCRIELAWQRAEIAAQKRLAEWRRSRQSKGGI
jgi:hypothetical protein